MNCYKLNGKLLFVKLNSSRRKRAEIFCLNNRNVCALEGLETVVKMFHLFEPRYSKIKKSKVAVSSFVPTPVK